MPSSDPRVLTETARQIIIANPKTVLDIGVGFGKWGMLAREYTDIWNYRFYPEEWQTRVTGIEIHERYRNSLWTNYNEILIGDAYDIVNSFEDAHYDLAIMIDVLEHFEKAKGIEFIKKVLKHADKFLVSYCNSEQKNVRDNKYEDHISRWEDREFYGYATLAKVVTGGPGWGVMLLQNR